MTHSHPTSPTSQPVLIRGWRLLVIGLGLAALAGLFLFFYFGGGFGMPSPKLETGSGAGSASIGARGPVTLIFSEPVKPESVEAGFSITPSVEGHFTWAGTGNQALSFWPARPLESGKRYTIRLAGGVYGGNGRRLRKEQSWQVEVRPADIILLSPSQAPEIWRISSDGQNRSQLTHTGGNVYDFNVSTDGNRIVYSLKNEQQGYDLWEVNRQGEKARLLLPCGPDWCTGPAYSPDGARVAYSRRKFSGLPGRQPEAPQIWLLERANQETNMLIPDPNVVGVDPAWSPDGRYLAFYDRFSSDVRVLDMQAHTSFLTPAEDGTGIEWSPDGAHLLYTQVEGTGEVPYNSVYELDVRTRQSKRVMGDPANPLEYSVPAWTFDGEWAAVGWRLPGGSANKQLWLVRLGGGQGSSTPVAITTDERFSHASYRWNPDGSLLAFQQLQAGAAGSTPQVVVWNREAGKTLLISEDAFQPQWIP